MNTSFDHRTLAYLGATELPTTLGKPTPHRIQCDAHTHAWEGGAARPDLTIGNVKHLLGHILVSRHLSLAAELLGHLEDGAGVLLWGGWGCTLGALGCQSLSAHTHSDLCNHVFCLPVRQPASARLEL